MDFCKTPLHNPTLNPGGTMVHCREQDRILAVIGWVHRAGFNNIATELRDALSLLPADKGRRA
jgi:hypothetical protein